MAADSRGEPCEIARTRKILAKTAATGRVWLAAWGTHAPPTLQRAARAFLLRLVAENGIEEAARVLRDLADELEGLPALFDDVTDDEPIRTPR